MADLLVSLRWILQLPLYIKVSNAWYHYQNKLWHLLLRLDSFCGRDRLVIGASLWPISLFSLPDSSSSLYVEVSNDEYRYRVALTSKAVLHTV